MAKTTKEKKVANEGKTNAINEALASIEKQFGKGAIMKLGDAHMDVETFSSGSIWVDRALWGWYAKWRIVEIYGPESSGKTTLTMHAIAQCQKAGWVAAFVDAEHAFDPQYATKLWINNDDLLFSQPDYGEQALEIVQTLVESGAVDLIVVDSVSALTPKAEIEWSMWDSHMGLQARMMSQWLRKLTANISKSNTTVIFINQIRMKIWVMFGSPETTSWGNSLKFYASQRIDIRRKWKIESWTGDNKEVNGSLTKVKVIKNKIAPPFREANIEIMFNQGISKVGEIIDFGVETEVLKKAWAFYSYGDIKLGQGKEKVKAFLQDEENKELYKEIETKIRELVV